ncbi:MAG: hypothetical protein CBE33_03085 [Candidatus Pelagibacter sp. TMED273]|nr:MAG: hypothetical protein CBE33_03085 [Candidatus Pelagibacter sp. TMED273]|tara:strand:- start:11273 stop:11668 length:396 start_codon:yes stop_codon:yes gene_type:complete
MFKLSKKVEYALISISHIKTSNIDKPISVRQISSKYNIPNELLAKILQTLSRVQILESIKGPKGGYKLKSTFKDLSLVEFIEILEGPFGIADCMIDTKCSQLLNCNIINPMDKINSKIYKVFSDIKLTQLT